MKKYLTAIALFLLLVPLTAKADEAPVFRLLDEAGETVTQYVGVPDAGDEYIAHDNRHYVVASVDENARVARLQSKGAYQMPDISWLEDDSTPVAAARRAVALYCTHSDESYVPTDGESSVTPRGGIYDVADALRKNLEAQGITVYFDDATHLPHDSGAYRRSRSTAEGLVKKGVDAVFDVHRDGIPDPEQYNTSINGEKASMVRLLVGRSNQNAAANKAFAAELKAVADHMYPELIRDIYIGKGTYNQDLSPHSVLLEFGTHTIEKERAEQATGYMAAAIQKTLYGGERGAAADGGTERRQKGVWSGVAVMLGVVGAGAVVFALASTGGVKPALAKLRGGAHELTGGLFDRKNRK